MNRPLSYRFLLTFCGAGSSFFLSADALYAWKPRRYTLPEMIAFSDVVGIIRVTGVEPPVRDSRGRTKKFAPKTYAFDWVEQWRRSPFIPSDGMTTDCRLTAKIPEFRHVSGLQLAFARYQQEGEYQAAASAYAVLPIDDMNRVIWPELYSRLGSLQLRPGFELLRSQIEKAENAFHPLYQKTVPVELAKKLIDSSVLDDREQTFATAPTWSFGLGAQLPGSQYRVLTFDTPDRPAEWWPEPVHDCYHLKGYVEATRLTDHAQEVLRTREPNMRVSGRWTNGWFLVTQVTDVGSGEVLLREEAREGLRD